MVKSNFHADLFFRVFLVCARLCCIVVLQAIEAGELEKAHRDARNTLEGTLSRRSTLSALEKKGYLEVRHFFILSVSLWACAWKIAAARSYDIRVALYCLPYAENNAFIDQRNMCRASRCDAREQQTRPDNSVSVKT